MIRMCGYGDIAAHTYLLKTKDKMAVTTENLQYAGQIVVDSVILVSADRKKKLDITLLMNEIDIFEDLFSPAMHGSVMLIDGFNLPSIFPIVGEELLVLNCHTPTLDTPINKVFSIVGVSDKYIKNSKTQVYLLNFASVESVVDMNLKVYNAFTGKPSDSAVQLFKRFFPNTKLRVEACGNTLKLVAPSISPFKMMNLLATKAESPNNFQEPNYLFYEDNQQYNFISLGGLFNQPVRTTYRWSYSQLREKDASGESTRDINAEYANAKDVIIDNVLNTLEKQLNGAMGHKVFEVDIVRKTIGKRTYSYLDDFTKVTHVDKFPVNTPNMMHNNDSVQETVVTHPAMHDTFRNDYDAIRHSKRPSMLAATEFVKLDIIVNGRTDIKVGDVVNFEMGQFATSMDNQALVEDKLDPYYSGRYVIGAIQHRITLQRHEMTLQIFKESFPNPITIS